MATLKPEDVFTPNAPVTEKEMFSERPLEIERINNALNEKGAQLLIYGPTGVGKTSLILYVLKLRGELHWTYRCDTVTTYQKIFSSIMAEWGPERVKSKKSTLGGKANLQTDFPFIVKGGVNGKIEKEKETIPWEEGVESLTIVNTIAPKGLILFFDDFEKIADITTKTVIANLSKHMSDIGAKHPKAKVVIVGIAESPANLIELDKSLTDRMHQIEINRMKDEEIAKIIEKGSKLLGLPFRPTVVNGIIQIAYGYPKYAHLLGLNLSRVAIKRGMKEVDETIFPDALKESIKRTEGLYRDLYHQATHHRSKSRGIHKEVLHAMALIDDEVVSHKDLEDHFRDKKPEIEYKHFIGPLGDLKKGKRGKVLKDYKETKGVTTFSNPMFKAFLRMKIKDEKP